VARTESIFSLVTSAQFTISFFRSIAQLNALVYVSISSCFVGVSVDTISTFDLKVSTNELNFSNQNDFPIASAKTGSLNIISI
jgi:hypothetical protein